MLLTYFSCSIVFFFAFWSVLLSAVYSYSFSITIGNFDLLMSVAFLLAGIAFHFLFIGLFSFLLKVFWDNPPKCLKPNKKLRLHLKSAVISIFSTFPIATGFWFHVSLKIQAGEIININHELELVPDILIKYLWAWFLCSFLIYVLILRGKQNVKRSLS